MLPLGRAADFWANEAGALGDGLMKGFGSFAVVLLLRVIFRRDSIAWLGLGLLSILIGLPSRNLSPAEWISLVAAAACVVAALRVGVVAGVVSAATGSLATCTPLTLDFSRWYAWRTAVVGVLLFAIAAWGFRATMGRRRILSGSMLEG
jgi:hypothetical protein